MLFTLIVVKITIIFSDYKNCYCSNYCIVQHTDITFMTSLGRLENSYKK